MKVNRLCSGLRDRNGHFIFEGDICMRNGDRMELVKICYGEFDVIELEKYRRVDSVKGWYCDVLITDEMSLMRPYNIRLPLNNFYIEHWNMEIVRDAEIYDKYSDIEYNASMIVASTVTPDLYNKELQDSYGVKKPEDLVYEMVDDPGEYQDLCTWVQDFQGFSDSLDDKVEEAKN